MDSNTNNQTTQSQNQEPGLVAGHAEYIKGVAEVCNFTSLLPRNGHSLTSHVCAPRRANIIWSYQQSAIGTVTGSQAWTASGEQDKAHAVHTMKAAGEKRDASAQGYGKVEELAGKAVGCEGMQQEGTASAKKE